MKHIYVSLMRATPKFGVNDVCICLFTFNSKKLEFLKERKKVFNENFVVYHKNCFAYLLFRQNIVSRRETHTQCGWLYLRERERDSTVFACMCLYPLSVDLIPSSPPPVVSHGNIFRSKFYRIKKIDFSQNLNRFCCGAFTFFLITFQIIYYFG